MALHLALLVANVILHAIVVARFGVGNHNQLFLIGILGLTVTFNQPVSGKALDKMIWLFELATILSTGFLLVARSQWPGVRRRVRILESLSRANGIGSLYKKRSARYCPPSGLKTP